MKRMIKRFNTKNFPDKAWEELAWRTLQDLHKVLPLFLRYIIISSLIAKM